MYSLLWRVWDAWYPFWTGAMVAFGMTWLFVVRKFAYGEWHSDDECPHRRR